MNKTPKDRGRSTEHSEKVETPSPSPQGPTFEEVESLSTLQLFDMAAAKPQGLSPSDVLMLRRRIAELEDVQDHARQTLEKMGEIVEKLRAPALRLGTLIQRLEEGRALVCVNGTDYVCNVDPEISLNDLDTGTRVLLNEAFAVTTSFGFDKNGPVVRISEVLSEGRLRVGNEHGITDSVVVRSSILGKEKLKTGLEVRLDANQRVAVEVLGSPKRVDRSVARVEAIAWDHIGGQADAVQNIRDSIELPFLHAHLFKRFNHPVPKGFLLYGPPGCGKTLLGKATAYNLRLQIREKTGEDRPEFFLNVKGPEILNMWLGESERQVRELFAQCREKAAEGHLAFMFIDEAESILGTRHSSRVGTNILSTLVPMFCAEMDGLEALQNVVVILASNRADLIDPAILRPGRIDRKIRVRRPNEEAAREIYSLYLTEDLPMAESRAELIEKVVQAHYQQAETNRFLEVTYRSGKREYLHRGDLASGAIIAAVVERAKEYAIKRSIKEETESPLTVADLLSALDHEYQESELFPPSDITEDWLKLTDFDPSNVVRLTACRSGRTVPQSGSI